MQVIQIYTLLSIEINVVASFTQTRLLKLERSVPQVFFFEFQTGFSFLTWPLQNRFLTWFFMFSTYKILLLDAGDMAIYATQHRNKCRSGVYTHELVEVGEQGHFVLENRVFTKCLLTWFFTFLVRKFWLVGVRGLALYASQQRKKCRGGVCTQEHVEVGKLDFTALRQPFSVNMLFDLVFGFFNLQVLDARFRWYGSVRYLNGV